RTLLGINSPASEENIDPNSRGFNGRSLNSGEQYNNPETLNKDCIQKNTGDYCFTNHSKKKLKVNLTSIGNGTKTLTLDIGQTQCFYELTAIAWNYLFQEVVEGPYMGPPFKGEGQIRIEKCKSKTFEIR